MPIQTAQAPTVFIKSSHDDADSSITKPISGFETREWGADCCQR